MKNFSFKNKQTVIKTLIEPIDRKRRFNWERWLFVVLVLGIATYIGQQTYNKFSKVNGQGQVEFATRSVTLPQDVELQDIYVYEGKKVAVGDTLFTYRINFNKEEERPMVAVTQKPIEWLIKEKLNIEKNIQLAQLNKNTYEREVEMKKQELARLKKLVVLGVSNEKASLLTLEQGIEKRLNLVQNESESIKYLQQHLRELKNQEYRIQQSLAKIEQEQISSQNSQLNIVKAFVAPTNGIIETIHFKANELCFKQQKVMDIHQQQEVNVKAYFPLEQVAKIKAGNKVNITFPDGSISKGIIDNIYVSTYALPAEFQAAYEPLARRMVAKVLPLNQSEADRWMNFYKMNVEVSQPIFERGLLARNTLN